MARSISPTKSRILTSAYGMLYKEGFARVSMDAVAAAAGVTKRTLYYHFDSKDMLVEAVLDHQHAFALARIRGWAKVSAKTPAQFVAALFEELEIWASQARWMGSGFTRLTLELADLPGHPARRAAHRHKLAVEVWLAGELRRLGARRSRELARQIMLLVEGSMSLILMHGDPRYAKTARRAASQLARAASRPASAL